MNCQFLQPLIGPMSSTVVTRQDCGLSLASGKLPIAFNGRDENAPALFQDNLRCHGWRRLNFHLQIDSIPNAPFKCPSYHESRTHKQKAIRIPSYRDTTKKRLVTYSSIHRAMKARILRRNGDVWSKLKMSSARTSGPHVLIHVRSPFREDRGICNRGSSWGARIALRTLRGCWCNKLSNQPYGSVFRNSASAKSSTCL
jgi:hypothetical protein